MLGYAAVVCVAVVLFWLDPILRVVSPSSSPCADAPPVRRVPLPPLNEALLALEDAGAPPPACLADDAYTVHVFSKAPLVLYVENFVSLAERKHLVEISAPLYEPSTVTHNGGGSVLRNATIRDSEVAVVPRTDAVRCIEARARRLQGWRDALWLERLRVQRYAAPAGHYGYHYDWSRSGAASGGWGRVSSLMVFVDDGALDGALGAAATAAAPPPPPPPLAGGGTAFPRLPRRSSDPRWCRFIGCAGDGGDDDDDDDEQAAGRGNATGVVFKPVPGNAVFWENFRPDSTGRAYEETWHAGLRVRQGVKIGLNIWSWGRLD